MQLTHSEVIPVRLEINHPIRMAGVPEFEQITAILIRAETRQGNTAWGAAVAHPDLTGERPEEVVRLCQECCGLIPDLHPTNIEYSLAELSPYIRYSSAATCAFNTLFYDLLGLASGLPLYRLLGGYRDRIRTSITLPAGTVEEGVEEARKAAELGFRALKIKGGFEPEEDIRRVKAIHRALPSLSLRLDADGGYNVQQSLEICQALESMIELFEQPTPADDLKGLSEVTRNTTVPILADQSIRGPDTALKLAANHCADGLSIKLATCGGFGAAQQVNAIARAAGLSTMVSCVVEPAILIGAGLSFALSSPNVHYCDLDGHLILKNDPTRAGFEIEDGWLVAKNVPGLGCTIEL
jgi:L-Ala-D/L-Glu epimerase / N-acetyl-D-glutamate racemase